MKNKEDIINYEFLQFVPGSQILYWILSYFRLRYEKVRDASVIASFMEAEDISNEIGDIIEEIFNFS